MLHPQATIATTARASLRHETQSAHVRLEESMRLVAPDLSLAEYVDTLARYQPIYVALERQIDEHAPALAAAGLDWEARRKVHLLRRDLAVLGPGTRAYPELPLAETSACTKTFARAMGCLYVMEGSSLGGRVIAKHVGRVLGLSADSGASFFDAYGDAVGAQWQAFCGVLERSLPDEATRRDAAAGAHATFELFIRHATPGGPAATR